jgi:hypothetical protein
MSRKPLSRLNRRGGRKQCVDVEKTYWIVGGAVSRAVSDGHYVVPIVSHCFPRPPPSRSLRRARAGQTYRIAVALNAPAWALDAGSPGFDAQNTAYVRVGPASSVVAPSGQVQRSDFASAIKMAVNRDIFASHGGWACESAWTPIDSRRHRDTASPPGSIIAGFSARRSPPQSRSHPPRAIFTDTPSISSSTGVASRAHLVRRLRTARVRSDGIGVCCGSQVPVVNRSGG